MKTPSFCNEIFDKLRLSEKHIYLKSLREFINISRDDLSKITGISTHTIRRYESEWENSHAPQWYEILMRFLCGDISFYSPSWADCTIMPWDKKLASPYWPHTRLNPLDMNAQYSFIHKQTADNNRRLNAEIERLKAKIIDLEAELEIERAKNDRLQSENAKLNAKHEGIKKGVVIPLFGQK
ncbi:MAG: hypothetical protein IE928_10335 [Gammaproteobacteria bacterium]|nr:hypothetical protein [Gammaproteobacteria bacterium]